jgi:sulfite exporter TauE/SafE
MEPAYCPGEFIVGGIAMSINVGMIDRIARIIVGIALIAFALGYIAPGTSWAWVGWIGVVPILTAIFGMCPLYSILGMSTK